MSNKNEKNLILAGLLGTFAASLCCITPLFALVAGFGGFASTFSWLEPLRPYLIIFTVFILGLAWFQKLNPKKEIDCKCETNNKQSFLQSNIFLGSVTLFAIAMMSFPYYSNYLFTNKKITDKTISKNNLQSLKLEIAGMTCDGCETFIEQTLSSAKGVNSVKVNYENDSAFILFDSTKTNETKIIKIIDATNYKVFTPKNK